VTRYPSKKDWLDVLSNFMAHNKGLPVFIGVGLALASLVLTSFPALVSAGGFGGWLVRSHLLLHAGVIIGLLGILIGDAL
jgi:hypothetical protein